MVTENNDNNKPVYFKSLTIQGVNCFKSEQTIDLTNSKGEPAMWTVILGNNNTGKTTVLRCLAGMETVSHKPALIPNPEQEYLLPKGFFKEFVLQNFQNLEINNVTVSATLSNIWIKSTIPRLREQVSYSVFSTPLYPIETTRPILIDGYGTQRREGKGSHIEYKLKDRTESLFRDEVESIINAEEWFLGTDYNALKDASLNINGKFKQNLEQVKDALITVLPDIKDIEINTNGERRVHFITNGGDKVLVNQLGSGYQSLITWVVDFAKRMFDRYPDSANPLAEPAIVLVDEIDLHLHPEWQRKIVAFLREKFPKTQFIVTAHSPLVIQSAEEINVVVLQKNETTDDVEIYQPEITNFQGWTVEEILSDLMKMGDKIYSNEYLKWFKQFDSALDKDDYESAQEAYQHLEKMVHSKATLKMLRMQMSSLMPKSND